MKTYRPTAEERRAMEDEVHEYPCQVCGVKFRSRRMLAVHPHKGGAK